MGMLGVRGGGWNDGQEFAFFGPASKIVMAYEPYECHDQEL